MTELYSEIVVVHEVTEKDNYSTVSKSRTYKVNGQLFRISIHTRNSGNYTISRFSEHGGWEWIEAEGGSFIGTINIDKNNIDSILVRLEQNVVTYAAITKPYKEVESQ